MNYTRQLGILNPDDIIFPVTFIGCGGIGSPTALLFAKMGCKNLTLIDPDKVEEHNVPNQMFRKKDIEGEKDKYKVEAMKEQILDFTDCFVNIVPELFEGQFELSGVVISGVHNMAARKKIWESVKNNFEAPLYIDGRIGGETIHIFTARPYHIDDIEFYEKYLFPDEDAAELPCAERGIMYTGFRIASEIALQFKKWLKKEKYYRAKIIDLSTDTCVLIP